jgi:pimeloyl-ACP methyl ester carboxylesterase
MHHDIPILFLHGGPGLSAIAERAHYGRSLSVKWWDQPRSVVLFANPFEELVDAAVDEVRQLADRRGAKVRLLAHSFGAQLAASVAARVGDCLAELLLLAPTHDLGDAFVRLATRLQTVAPDPQRFSDDIDAFREARTFERLADLVRRILTIPTFLDTYWRPESASARLWFADLMAREAVFDVNAFFVILESFWQQGQGQTQGQGPLQTSLPAHLVFGDEDPLVDAAAGSRFWAERFAVASSQVATSGHFIQFELPPEQWWPAAWA